MSLTINGESLTIKKNKSQIQFHMFNPTKMNIKKEIINFKTKLQSRQFKSTPQKSLLPDYEPKVLILPKTTSNNGKELRTTEFIFSKKLKSDGKGKFDKKFHTIYKARSTLKTRVYNHNNILEDNQMPFSYRSNSSFPTSSYFYPKFAPIYGGSQSNSLCTILNRKKNDYIDKIQKLTQNVAKIEKSSLLKNNNSNGFNTNNSLTYILEKKLDKDLPITLPVALTHNLKYESQSQRSRNQKIIETLSKLKFFLHNHPDLKKEIVKEFFVKHKITGKEFYTAEKLDNFARFIRKGITIKPNKTMKDIIIEGIEFTTEKLNEYRKEEEDKEKKEKSKDILPNDKKENVKGMLLSSVSSSLFNQTKMTKTFQKSHNKSYSNTASSSKIPLIRWSSSNLVFDMNEQKKKQYEPSVDDSHLMLPEDHINYLKEDIASLNKIADNQTKGLDRCAERLYYDFKFKHDGANLKDVAKKKSKLLEYIVYENAMAMKQLNEDTKIIEQEHQNNYA